MRTPAPRDFQSDTLTVDLIDDATPPANVALLLAAILWPEAAALTPYCGTGHQFDALGSANVELRYLGIVTPPAAVHCRAALSRGWAFAVTATGTYHEATTSDGGATGNDIIRVSWYVSPGGFVPEGAFSGMHSDIAVSSATKKDAPTFPSDRLFEVQTLGYPYVEPWSVTKVAGFSVVPTEQLADLETL